MAEMPECVLLVKMLKQLWPLESGLLTLEIPADSAGSFFFFLARYRQCLCKPLALRFVLSLGGGCREVICEFHLPLHLEVDQK